MTPGGVSRTNCFQVGSFNLNIMAYPSQMGDNQKMKVLYFIEFLKLEKRICPQNQDLLHVGRDMAVFMKCLPFNVRKRPYLKLLKEKFNKAKITN